MAPTSARDWSVTTASLASDISGNIYSAGTIFGAFDFGAGLQPAGGDSDAYVNRMNPNTGVATWTRDFGDASAQQGLGVAASSAMIGVIGNYIGTVTGTSLPPNAGSVQVNFILGLNPADGTTVWGKKVDLAGGNFSVISSNPTLNAFVVCGIFGGTTTVAGGAGATDLVAGAVAGGAKDLVVAKINAADGTVAWARQIGGTGAQTCASATFNDDGSNVYLTGTYGAATGTTLDLGTGAFPATTNASSARLWVAKLNGSTGATVSAQTWGTTGAQQPAAITTDSSGNVLVAGGFLVSIPFGGAAGTITSEGSTDAFVVKLDSNLAPMWAHNWGGGADAQKVQSVATDSAGNVFAVGLFGTSINLGTGGAAILSAGNSDAFTLKLDPLGNVMCAATYGDGAGQEADAITVARLATTNKDKAMMSGAYAGSITLGTTTLNTGNASIQHVYVSAINENSF